MSDIIIIIIIKIKTKINIKKLYPLINFVHVPLIVNLIQFVDVLMKHFLLLKFLNDY